MSAKRQIDDLKKIIKQQQRLIARLEKQLQRGVGSSALYEEKTAEQNTDQEEKGAIIKCPICKTNSADLIELGNRRYAFCGKCCKRTLIRGT